jgi:potassium/hydrogen antiporter
MNFGFEDILWISGLLLLAGILLNRPSKRFGVPGLILYLSLGTFIGNGGENDFLFDFPNITLKYSELAIGFIIFIGGLETRISRFKNIALQGFSLASLGVLICSLLVGLFAWLFLGFSFIEGWLLGAIISSTDAAAVFSILESNKLKLKEGISETLELESGTNDPMAYFLTIALTGVLKGSDAGFFSLSLDFLLGILIGLILGLALGRIAVGITQKLRLDIQGLYPLILLSIALIALGISNYLHANVLLTMYVVGITIGNGKISYRTYSINFFESISWLMEISLFIILGLQIFPRQILPFLGVGITIAAFLMLIARPASVFLALRPFNVSRKKKLFISWIGLRGATPIAFSLVPLVAGVQHSNEMFNAVFIIVITSILLQGTTLRWAAHKLGLIEASSSD